MKFKVLDIEVFPNVFIAVIKDIETKEIVVVEKSRYRDNTYLLKELLYGNYVITYNGKSYDDIVINYIIQNDPTPEEIKEFSDYLINRNVNDNSSNSLYKKYKYINHYTQIDLLTMLFSKKLRVSLKALQVMLKWHNVLECEIPFDKYITKDEIKTVIEYCKNDVEFTEYLTVWCKNDLKFRFELNKEYGINTLSSDPVKIGVDLMSKFIGKKLIGKTLKFKDYGQENIELWGKKIDRITITNIEQGTKFVKRTRFTPKPFYLGEIVNDFIKFDSPVLKQLLEEIKNFKYRHKENYFEKRIKFENTIYDIGSGGLHSYFPHPKIITPGKNEFYKQADYKSYYPSQRVFLKYPHEIWGDLFWEEDRDILYGRWEAQKNGHKVKDASFKLLGNALFGQFGNEWNQFCSPKLGNSQTINGQLMILMHIEWLVNAGVLVLASNTDSVDIVYNKSIDSDVINVGKKFKEVTKGITVEYDDIAKAVYSDINCYFMLFANGKIKEKGRWVTHYDKDGNWKPQMLNKGFRHPIINVALRNYFLKNISIEDTIYNHTDILDFCMSEKVDKSFNVWHGINPVYRKGDEIPIHLREDWYNSELKNSATHYKVITDISNKEKLQRINRWYASTTGGYLYKEKNGSYNHMLKGQGVTVLNYCDERNPKFYKDLNYKWYISQARKQIDEVIPKQLSLF